MILSKSEIEAYKKCTSNWETCDNCCFKDRVCPSSTELLETIEHLYTKLDELKPKKVVIKKRKYCNCRDCT
jgi:hypothetical protein